MLRRSFLVWAGASGLAAAGSVAGFQRWQEITPAVHYPGRDEGHFLRDRRALPPPSQVIDTDIAILGSGIAGLTAAWKLKKLGHTDLLMIDGPQPHGNAAGGRFRRSRISDRRALPAAAVAGIGACARDPGRPGHHQRDPIAEKPTYDERFILHGPEERLLFNGRLAGRFHSDRRRAAMGAGRAQALFAEVERLRRCAWSGRPRVFVFPTVMSSEDPQWQALDRITLKQWLDQSGYRSPTLHWYLNYCCRDDYGTRYDKVSAWAGLHYYCSRWGQAANAGNGAWLTWPGGLQPLAATWRSVRRGAHGRHRGVAQDDRRRRRGAVLQAGERRGRTYLVRARKAICAMPVYVAARVVDNIGAYGFDPAKHTRRAYAPWMVANFLMKRFPASCPAPLSWDNVVYQEPGLGYVVSTHQDIRVRPPEKTVFSAYVALSDRTPDGRAGCGGQARGAGGAGQRAT
jgi:hypothetical protein